MGKKIISFCLWGDNPLYTKGAIWNAENREKFYPDWNCRFYYDKTVPVKCINAIKKTGSELVKMEQTTDVLGMFWRFHPMFDDISIERVIVRDTDSKFCKREVNMVNQWIGSGKPFHIIRDCESHATTILGGTWGAIPGFISNFEERISYWLSQAKPDFKNPRGIFHGCDQMFLDRMIWPLIRDNHMAHIRKGMKHLIYSNNNSEIEVDDPEDNHYIGMVC